jgi:hypothetical protein
MEVSELVRGIADDVRTIAKDEVELVQGELQRTAREAALEVGLAVLGGIVALIGLGMLCVAAVAGLAPAIPQLWLRLIIMAVVYLAIGGAVAAAEGRRLARTRPRLGIAKYEAKRAMAGVKELLTHA